MVFGVVTLIEGEAGEQIHALWRLLAEALGPEAIAEMTHPHTTYHCADDYDLDRLDAAAVAASKRVGAFTLRVPGVLVNAREGRGMTALNLARPPQLNELHEALWEQCCAASLGAIYDRYAAPTWVPHVTLSYSALVHDRASMLIEAMRKERLPREVRVDNVALIRDTGAGHELIRRWPLTGA